MPVYNPVLKPLNKNEIKRYSGLNKYADFPAALIDKACDEAYLLAQPAASWQIYDYNCETALIMAPTPLQLHAPKVIRYLGKSIQVAVISVTIKEQLEEQVNEYFQQGEYTAGLLLDAAGTAAVEVAADQVCDFIKNHAARQGYLPLPRFSPGYGEWDITVQPTVLALAEAASIQVTATESCMLLPRKSITAIIGLTPNLADIQMHCEKEVPCLQCTQENCLARKDDIE